MVSRNTKEGSAFYLKLASAPVRTYCTDRVLIVGGELDKSELINGPATIEIIDLGEPEIACQIVGDWTTPSNLPSSGISGGLLSPGNPIVCGAECHYLISDETSFLQLPSIHSASLIISQSKDTLFITGGVSQEG